ncbi:MAG: polyphosphate kinase 2 family protein [Planctomycetota bacterium]
MFEAVSHPHLVSFDGKVEVSKLPTAPPGDVPKETKLEAELTELTEKLDELQRKLWAQDRWSVLFLFQALDAAGKDSTIRAVLSGVNPAGVHVASFKQPTHEELDHDFLWRSTRKLPGRGTIGVFNRSYYEEVLVVRVHPELLTAQRLPEVEAPDKVWKSRFRSIRQYEKHLARSGTVIVKFWLNVSPEEQRQRFLARIDDQRKNWKFSEGDVEERQHFKEYLEAYEDVLRETSKPWAPWYAIPADDKPYMRREVGRIMVATLESLRPEYPRLGDLELDRLQKMRKKLES